MTTRTTKGTRCHKCGRSYHKTNRAPNVPYTVYDERLIKTLAARGFTAMQIALCLNDINSVRVPGLVRNSQNIREKARCMGVKLVSTTNWQNQYGRRNP